MQANTAIKSEATQRAEAFTDLDVSLAGAAAARLGAEGPATNGAAAPGSDSGLGSEVGLEAGAHGAANGNGNAAEPRPAGRRKGPAPMPDAAKEALTASDRARRRRPASVGAPAAAPGPPAAATSAADAAAAAVAAAATWSEEQELALVRVGFLPLYLALSTPMSYELVPDLPGRLASRQCPVKGGRKLEKALACLRRPVCAQKTAPACSRVSLVRRCTMLDSLNMQRTLKPQ